MLEPTGYHLLSNQLERDLVNHGWGEMTFRVTSLKDQSVKIEVLCGKSYVFIINKEIKFGENII
mgnify:CR=1 FL=1